MLISSCSNKSTEPPITEPSKEFTFSDFVGMTTLPTENVWIITDDSGTADDFTSLKSALLLAWSKKREIKLEFQKITAIPIDAFNYCAALTSVSAPKATTIGANAFNYCAALTSVSAPLATSIGTNAFDSCVALTTMTIATNSTLTLGTDAFTGIDANKITVTTSKDNVTKFTAILAVKKPVTTVD